MQQRPRGVSGRPSGTDGSDYSYRMVVDSRYTKVAKGKSRLQLLITIQAISQVIGLLLTILFASKEKGLDKFSILSITIGFLSILIGEIGRRRSLVTLLRLYSTSSSMAAALSVACLVRSEFFFEVIHKQDISSMKGYEFVETGRVLFAGILLQIVVIITTIALVQNMSPKRSSLN